MWSSFLPSMRCPPFPDPLPCLLSRSLVLRGSSSLLSCSGVEFRLEKKKLSAHSTVFGDMFETGTDAGDGADKVVVTEPSDVLAVALTIGLGQAQTVELDDANFWDIVKTFDKYDVSKPCWGREGCASLPASSLTPAPQLALGVNATAAAFKCVGITHSLPRDSPLTLSSISPSYTQAPLC